ncbi:MAG: hypothetical protein AABX99_03965 [Nanoarchaeota archaeon]
MAKNYLEQAILEGVDSILKEHPRFAGFQEYLLKHIDRKKIRDNISALKDKTKGMSGDEVQSFIYQEIADYVSSGEAFDERGKKIILKNSLEGKTEGRTLLQKLFRKPKFDGEKYLDETMEAFGDLYSLFKTGNYAQRMPALTKSIETLYDLRFLNPAIDILKQNGMIDDKKYAFLKKEVYSKAQESSKNVVGGIEKYFVPEKIAASILGIFGISLVMMSLKITGAVVGVQNNISSRIIGIGLIVLAVFIFFFPSKKKHKR